MEGCGFSRVLRTFCARDPLRHVISLPLWILIAEPASPSSLAFEFVFTEQQKKYQL